MRQLISKYINLLINVCICVYIYNLLININFFFPFVGKKTNENCLNSWSRSVREQSVKTYYTIKDMKPLKDFKQKCDLIRLLKTGNYWKSLLKTWCSLGQRQWQFGNFFSETKMSNSITLSLDFPTSSLSVIGVE